MKTLATSLVLFSSSTAFAGAWELDPAHTAITFGVKHMVVTTAKGQFKQFTGKVDWSDKDITKSTVDVSIDAASIDTNNEKRDTHLKGEDFFDTAKHPKITFKSTKIEKAGKGLKITGDLTIKGTTKSVVFSADGPTAPAKNPWGGLVSSFHASAKINRKDFGLNWNKTLESGGVLVGDEVTLEIDGELNQPQPAKS